MTMIRLTPGTHVTSYVLVLPRQAHALSDAFGSVRRSLSESLI
ncbi:hypothetical protein QM565_05100 [Geitlerinema splendidum]|nr:hypothetical protein [Geitlerinema splendidum]